MTIRPFTATDRDALLDIWLRSVRATHHFLTEADIQGMLPTVRDKALVHLELWVLCNDDGGPIGFAGLTDANVDALFIDPDWFRQGGGRMLLDHARQLKGSLTLDVNDRNPDALKFYQACGFEVVGRSETDGQGRPFPLLHLRDSLASRPQNR